jgi:hypothetical protein
VNTRAPVPMAAAMSSARPTPRRSVSVADSCSWLLRPVVNCGSPDSSMGRFGWLRGLDHPVASLGRRWGDDTNHSRLVAREREDYEVARSELKRRFARWRAFIADFNARPIAERDAILGPSLPPRPLASGRFTPTGHHAQGTLSQASQAPSLRRGPVRVVAGSSHHDRGGPRRPGARAGGSRRPCGAGPAAWCWSIRSTRSTAPSSAPQPRDLTKPPGADHAPVPSPGWPGARVRQAAQELAARSGVRPRLGRRAGEPAGGVVRRGRSGPLRRGISRPGTVPPRCSGRDGRRGGPSPGQSRSRCQGDFAVNVRGFCHGCSGRCGRERWCGDTMGWYRMAIRAGSATHPPTQRSVWT